MQDAQCTGLEPRLLMTLSNLNRSPFRQVCIPAVLVMLVVDLTSLMKCHRFHAGNSNSNRIQLWHNSEVIILDDSDEDAESVEKQQPTVEKILPGTYPFMGLNICALWTISCFFIPCLQRSIHQWAKIRST